MSPAHELIVENVLTKAPDAVAIYLFGSRTRPRDIHADSDWDVAVLGAGKGLDPAVWFDLKMELSRTLDVDKVDLVDLKRSNFVIRDTVLREGQLLYDAAPAKRIKWELASEKLVADWVPKYEQNFSDWIGRLEAERV